MRDKWEEELVIAEYRLKERARAEKRLQAVEETSKRKSNPLRQPQGNGNER